MKRHLVNVSRTSNTTFVLELTEINFELTYLVCFNVCHHLLLFCLKTCQRVNFLNIPWLSQKFSIKLFSSRLTVAFAKILKLCWRFVKIIFPEAIRMKFKKMKNFLAWTFLKHNSTAGVFTTCSSSSQCSRHMPVK